MTQTRWLVAFALLTAIAAVSATRLRIQAEPVDLLPLDSPAARDYRLYLDEFGGIEDLFVLVRSPLGAEADPESVIDAAEQVAAELEALPQISRVQSGIDAADEKFLLEQILPIAPLLRDRPGPDLQQRLQPGPIRERVEQIRTEMFGPTGGATARIRAADPLGFGEELLLERAGGIPVEPLSGSFYSAEHGAALLIASPASGTLDAGAGRAILDTLNSAEERLVASGQSIEVLAVGGPLYAAQDETAMRGDLIGTVLSSLIAIGLVLLAYFRGFGLPLALTLAVLAGVILTAGTVAAIDPTISVLGVAFASILIGLGIDYGIHGATRFQQRLDAGEPAEQAMQEAIADCRGGILSSVATTASVFGVLLLASFPPLRQLGWIVALGMLLVLLATRGFGAPLAQRMVGAVSSRGSTGRSQFLQRWIDGGTAAATQHGAGRFAVIAVALLVFVVGGIGIGRLQFNADLRALRAADHPAIEAERALLSTFDLGLESTSFVVAGPSVDEALDRATELTTALRSASVTNAAGAGAESTGRVESPTDWVPSRNTLQQRLARLPHESFALAADELERALLDAGFRLEPFARSLEALRSIGRGVLPDIPVLSESPRWVLDAVRPAVREDSDRTHVHVRFNGAIGSGGSVGSDWLDQPDVAVASVPRLGRELQRKIGEDFRRLDLWALAAVFSVVAISFRGRIVATLLALVPVLFGSVVTLGFFGWLGRPLDPFTLLVAPILLGIGVDDGLHVLHGVQRHGGVVAAVRHAGQALTLTTLTTSIGFGSLWFSSVPALQRGGLAVAAGVWICWLATVFLLPALARSRSDSSD